MANKPVEIPVSLKPTIDAAKYKEDLKKLVQSISQIDVKNKQTERVGKLVQGAELAIKTNDIKSFQKNFNVLAEIFKETAAASGNLSKELQAATETRTKLNKELNSLRDKSADLKSKLTEDQKALTSETAKNFAKSQNLEVRSDKKRLLGRDSVVERALKLLADPNVQLKGLSNKQAQNFGFSSREDAWAAAKYVKKEDKFLQKTQQELLNTETDISQKEQELAEFEESIQNLEKSVNNASLSLDKFYKTTIDFIQSVNNQITTEKNEIKQQTKSKTAAFGSGTLTELESIKNTNDKQITTLGKVVKQFSLYAIALRSAKQAAQTALTTIKEIDKQLTEQAMVTGLTREQTYGLIGAYQDLAKQTGATTKEIAGVATEYIKQGKSISETMTLTRAAVSAAKVAGVSTADSVNYLTTALNGFQLAAEDAMLVSDKFAAVAAASATDYDELAIALSKVASQANLAGMSIDYTTALLTKGLETTREAPETMGTALKTIIARMRELGDYGETLEGDTDLNNVESQLAYVGIALRNTEGELRSTEDVLDELGRKWDTLNKNQQAAVAKALAGTRQQSRLIAMMTDYERVIELQRISEESAGATAAQAGVYLEGMEAALNKITVAWEKIVTTATDSEFIIGVFNIFSDTLEVINTILDSTGMMIPLILVLGSLGAISLVNKIQEKRIQFEQNKLILQQNGYLLEQKKIENEIRLQKLQTLKIQKQKDISTWHELLAQAKSEGNIEDIALATKELAQAETELALIDNQINQEKIQQIEIGQQIKQNSLDQITLGNGMLGIITSFIPGLQTIVSLMKTTNLLQTVFNKKKTEEIGKRGASAAAAAAEQTAEMELTATKMAGSASSIPVVGWIIAGTILAALLGIAIAGIAKYTSSASKAEKTAEQVNALSNEIYKLNEKVNSLNQITTSFEDLDNKLIKTNSDLKEMNSLLEQAADQLSDEEDSYMEGISEKEYYQSLTTDQEKIEFLNQIEENARNKANAKRQEQLDAVNEMDAEQLQKFLDDNTSNADIKQGQSAIRAINNARTYDYFNDLEASKSTKLDSTEFQALKDLTTQTLAELNMKDVVDYANDPEKLNKLMKTLTDIKIEATDAEGKVVDVLAASVLGSDDYSVAEKAEAFNELKKTLGESSAEFQAFAEVYSDVAVFAKMESDVLEIIDVLGLTNEELNKLNESWKTLNKAGFNFTQAEYQDLLTKEILPALAASGGDIESTIDAVFGSYLSSVEDYEDAYNAIVNSFADVMSEGMLNMGQNITKLKNSINTFYETASKWGEMSDAEKTEFLQDNAELFQSDDGELLDAFESGDYMKIQEALQKNEGLKEKVQEELNRIDQELMIEEQRLGEERNEAYIKYLKEQKAQLENTTELFRADLETLIEQEEKQLSIYKEYLQKQQEELEETMDKRKEAYQDYFDAIGQQQEDEDYQEESDLLVANLAKIASSTDAATNKQRAELEQQLLDLEKERQDELRQRAQDALLEGLDKSVEEINEKFDKLLNNEQALLDAMRGDMQNSDDFLLGLLAQAKMEGLTDLQMEQRAEELRTTYSSVIDTSNIDELLQQINNSATININGQTIDLTSEDGDAVWKAIQEALIRTGYGII